MRGRLRTLAVAAAGVVVGGLVTLAMPAPGGPPEDPAPTSAPRLEKVRPNTLLAWTPVQLPDGFAEAAARVPGVRSVAEVRSGVGWLVAWSGEDGRGQRPPEAMRIPIEIAAVDPATYTSFVPAADAPSIAGLARAGIVLGRGSAALRGISRRGALAFDDVTLDVTGVVDDGLIGAHEGVVGNTTGERLGIVRPRYLLVEVAPDASPDDVERALASMAPPGVRVRIRAPGETPEFRHGDAVLPPLRLKEIFGEFAAAPAGGADIRVDREWVRANIRTATMPRLGTVRCHDKILGQMRAAFDELVRRGLDDLVDPQDFGGCFVPRFLSRDEGAGLSHHSWGIAFDLNVSQNAFGSEPRMDPRVVEVFERWGFAWGGRWLVPDGMQFEFLRFPLSPKG